MHLVLFESTIRVASVCLFVAHLCQCMLLRNGEWYPSHTNMEEKIDLLLRQIHDFKSQLGRIESRLESRHGNIVPTDDVDDSRSIEDVYVLSKITSVVEDTLVDFDTSIIDEVHASSECTSDSKYELVESSIPIQIVKYSLPTPMLDDGIESETIASSIITSSKPSIPSCTADCQTHTYFSQEQKRPVHLLNLNPFSKESRVTDVNSIVVTPNVFFSLSKYLEFSPKFCQILVSPSDVIPLVVFDALSLKNHISLFLIFRSQT